MVIPMDGAWQCSVCGFHYKDNLDSHTSGKEWAEKCESWCKEHHSCNLEITEHAEESVRGLSSA
ncbi:hypothetical protein COU20_02535 [Candidatus Kaiserbacteria bacterium CG10_big_fil_rev_8_21_14_0_10_59_10]|uniref:Uncharacterized protein n=1 Tax=Candidatus Kaiserbacteria bacterium CG10_big_fil_rev_8_21_14_0_10_59_10 TaxID=1974612 RepID=A0A2H0U9L3_9BACT|nr:MAG: hypothetical protein COU20_02535 [Candidatus Kaiserbacteria bacterium CG10_big_fil_rev_8_21_14_0_10_59_10]